jgi:hypothetical protein
MFDLDGPEALKLAEFCEGNVLYQPAGAMLRRQHAEIERLRGLQSRSFEIMTRAQFDALDKPHKNPVPDYEGELKLLRLLLKEAQLRLRKTHPNDSLIGRINDAMLAAPESTQTIPPEPWELPGCKTPVYCGATQCCQGNPSCEDIED